MWAIGEQIKFAACLICVEYFYRVLGRLISLNVWIYLLLPKYIVDSLGHLQRVIQVTFFCACAQLKARTWQNERRIPELLTEKFEKPTCQLQHCCDQLFVFYKPNAQKL